ncbi:hypothetical protein CEXT_58551 [Caerostris extrusa]|uniref:Uncharacterized protein n=1 Tax=Caerostris extrusa TaxID=172846 RepID=A0AAV4U068_CAEEX|nr:hypothetical protein CEXT_58551 [Caerostris extrusa]
MENKKHSYALDELQLHRSMKCIVLMESSFKIQTDMQNKEETDEFYRQPSKMNGEIDAAVLEWKALLIKDRFAAHLKLINAMPPAHSWNAEIPEARQLSD